MRAVAAGARLGGPGARPTGPAPRRPPADWSHPHTRRANVCPSGEVMTVLDKRKGAEATPWAVRIVIELIELLIVLFVRFRVEVALAQ